MKILFVSNNLSRFGGIERYNQNFINALLEGGENIAVLQLKKSNLFNKIFFSAEIILKTLFFRPRVIICGHINFSPICLFLKKIFGFDYLAVIHGIEAWNIKSKIKKIALENSKKVIAVSNYTAKAASSGVPAIKDKIFILPNSVDGSEFLPKKKSLELLEKHNLFGKKIILTVARLAANEQMKGYDKIIKGLPKVIKAIPEIRYLLVGDGTDVQRIKNLVQSLNLEKYVVMAGFIPADLLADYYNLCDIYVMPSVSEGFGIVFIEALACGKPVIAGDIDASAETLLGGELGILVNPNNKSEISGAIVKILKKQVPARLLDGNYLRNKTLETYSLEKFKERALALLKAINSNK